MGLCVCVARTSKFCLSSVLMCHLLGLFFLFLSVFLYYTTLSVLIFATLAYPILLCLVVLLVYDVIAVLLFYCVM